MALPWTFSFEIRSYYCCYVFSIQLLCIFYAGTLQLIKYLEKIFKHKRYIFSSINQFTKPFSIFLMFHLVCTFRFYEHSISIKLNMDVSLKSFCFRLFCCSFIKMYSCSFDSAIFEITICNRFWWSQEDLNCKPLAYCYLILLLKGSWFDRQR